jgi:hypothetical protein
MLAGKRPWEETVSAHESVRKGRVLPGKRVRPLAVQGNSPPARRLKNRCQIDRVFCRSPSYFTATL